MGILIIVNIQFIYMVQSKMFEVQIVHLIVIAFSQTYFL